MKTEKYNVTVTDLFGGELNYSWVRKRFIEIESLSDEDWKDNKKRALYYGRVIRAAKAAVDYTGVRCNFLRNDAFNGYWLMKVRGQNVAIEISFNESEGGSAQ